MRVASRVSRAGRTLALLLLTLCTIAPAAGAPLTLRVGMVTRTPPWVFVLGLDLSKEDETKVAAINPEQLNRLTGLVVDVMKALTRRLGTARVVPTAWGDLEAGLVAKRYDLILCGWTPNPKTPSAIAASVP
jgi:ABC-type amino acid transport substrate-binding protein